MLLDILLLVVFITTIVIIKHNGWKAFCTVCIVLVLAQYVPVHKHYLVVYDWHSYQGETKIVAQVDGQKRLLRAKCRKPPVLTSGIAWIAHDNVIAYKSLRNYYDYSRGQRPRRW